jgi:hypothetical protein
MKITRHNLPQAFKKGFTPWNKGMKNFMTPEGRQSMIDSKKGKPSWNKGKKCAWVTKKNIENNHLMRGEKAYHWKGGRARNERARDMQRQEYKQWRTDVFKRDNWTCQTCQARG